MSRIVALALLLVGLLGGAAFSLQPMTARADATVDFAGVENNYPKNLTFKVTARSDQNITDASLAYSITGANTSALGKPSDFQAGKNISTSVVVETNSGSSFIPVGSEFTWHWDLTTADGKKTSTPDQKFVYLPTGQDWQSVQSDIMVIYYHGNNQTLANSYLAAASQTYDKMAKNLLATQLKVVPVRVVLFDSGQESAVARQSQGATFDQQTETCGTKFAINVIHLIPASCGSSDPTDTLRHEFTHVINETAGEGVPGEKGLGRLTPWLDEGTAVNGQSSPGSGYSGAFQAAVRSNQLIPFADMTTPPSDPAQVNLFYGQSYFMVKYLIDKGGGKFAQLFATIRKGTRYDDAIKQVFGFDMSGFETEFRAANGLPPLQQAASPTSRPQPPTATAPAAATVQPTAAATASGSTSSSGGSDKKPVVIIVGVAVLFGLLAVLAYLASVMMANNRRQAAARAAGSREVPQEPPQGPPPQV